MCSVADDQLPSEIGEPGRAESAAQFISEFLEDPAAGAMMREAAADPKAFLNTLRIPTDAGEYAEGLAAILDRIPEGWGRWVSCGRGWYPLLIETDRKLAALDPAYEVHQVKEKYGGLRYYHQLVSAGADHEAAFRIGQEAKSLSLTICELCGAPGSVRDDGFWIWTRCDEHDPTWKGQN
jgi:hypothetical protein